MHLSGFKYSDLIPVITNYIDSSIYLYLIIILLYTVPFNINEYVPFIKNTGGCPRGVMVKAMDSGIVIREFVLQLRYYVHFRANTLGKCMNPLILPAMGYIVPLLFF